MNSNELVIGKSELKSSTYDLVYFCNRTAKDITIPSTIKRIESYAFAQSLIENICISSQVTQIGIRSFYKCKRIKNVIFQSDSKLQIIGKEAFAHSSIQKVVIPKHVTHISVVAFGLCQNLKQIEFEKDSELHTIDKEAFAFSSIEFLSIPSSVVELKEAWCAGNQKLKKVTIFPNKEQNIIYYKNQLIIGKSDIKSDKYDVLYFVDRDVKTVIIPSSVTRIEPYAFSQSLIENIAIPPHITKICEKAFIWCKMLKSVEISIDSKIQSIEANTFADSTIESLSIPSSICELKEGWCNGTPNLKKVAVIENKCHNIMNSNELVIGKSELKSSTYDLVYFCNRTAKEITIPSTIKRIESYAFYGSLIEKIFIPHHITKICVSAFANCTRLKCVDIPNDSELQVIENDVFGFSLIKSIYIPSSITHIDSSAFAFCELKIAEFGENNSIQMSDLLEFDVDENTLFMIPNK